MQPNEVNYYAIQKVAEASKNIAFATQEMPILRKKLEKHMESNKIRAKGYYEDLQKLKGKVIEALRVASLSLVETEEKELAAHSTKLITSLKAFNLMTPDYTKLCTALNSYLSSLPTHNQTTNTRVIGRLMNRVKLGYYPTDLEHLAYLKQAIAFPADVTVNLLDPCCGCGLALHALVRENAVNTFGVELDEYRAEEALTRLDRVGFGSFFHSRISNESFHGMLLNPPYLSVLSKSGQNFRSEKRFLVDSLSHLMMGGLLIYIIPYYRLTDDICKVLSDNFTDITVWKFFGEEFAKYKQIAVMGIKQKRQSNPEIAQKMSLYPLYIENMPEISQIPKQRYTLPNQSKKVDLFKGADFNITELANQLKNSKSFSKLFQKNKLDHLDKRPLLPLNIGQIGLIGGSGLINGLIECDAPHIIKGRIVKETRTREESGADEKANKTLYETTTNKMIFNLLTPEGFKSLS